MNQTAINPFEDEQAGEPMMVSSRNLCGLLGWRGLLPGLVGALASGLLLSSAFSPLEWWWAAWIALVPLMVAPMPQRFWRRLVIGYVFGFSHFATSLRWLNTVGFFAGYLLALVCALFLLAWYLLLCDFVETAADAGRRGGPPPFRPLSLVRLKAIPFMVATLFAPTMWVGLEWVRSWFFTGFPWNHAGLSQWRNLGLLQVTTVTGIYGVSFLLVVANLAFLWMGLTWWRRLRGAGGTRGFPWPVLLAALFFVPALWLARSSRTELAVPDRIVEIAAVQGNIPQIRQWTQEQLDHSLEVYDSLTREAVAAARPDLIVWPETAIPAPLFYHQQYHRMMTRLLGDIKTPMLFGTIHLEPMPGSDGEDHSEYSELNSVFYIDGAGQIVDSYYKLHLVPFGEFVPLGNVFPVLHDIIGMGRDITPGREYTLFEIGDGVYAGVNICFEDAFPRISRNFVLRGANLLMTLTNDAWFGESVGSRQHMIHAVLRAVENRRPLLRSGNNSDTALILPNGEVTGLLYDDSSGNRFVRDWRSYAVPVWFDLGITFYTRHGDRFAQGSGVMIMLWLIGRATIGLRRRRASVRLMGGQE